LFFVAHLGLKDLKVRGRTGTEELGAIFEDFGLGDDEGIADDFEKLGLHSENVVVIEYIGHLGPMLVSHGGVVDKFVG
jgi:hypothetical protein